MRPFRFVLAGAAATCLLTACSSSGGSGSPKSEPPDTSTGTTTTVASPSAGSTAGDATATDALLVAGDVGGNFTQQPYVASDNPPPCNSSAGSLDKQVPPKIAVGRDLAQNSPAAFIEEEYKIYSDVATAQKALATAKAGLNCTEGKDYNDDGTTDSITITGPGDAKSALGADVDEAYGWSLKNTTIIGSALAIRIGDRLVLLTFAAQAGTDTSTLPDITTIAKKSVAKVLASS